MEYQPHRKLRGDSWRTTVGFFVFSLFVATGTYTTIQASHDGFFDSTTYRLPELIATQPLLQVTAEIPLPTVPTDLVTVQQTGISEPELNQRLTGMLSHIRWLLGNQTPPRVSETVSSDSLTDEVALLKRQLFHFMDESEDDDSDVRADVADDLTALTLDLTDGVTLTDAILTNPTATGTLTVNGSLTTTGSLGVGTTSPTDTLAVAGPIYLSPSTPANTVARLYNSAGTLYWDGSPVGIGGGGSGTVLPATVAGRLAYYPTATSTVDDASALYWDETNGRLGIGTSSPYAKLSVAGEVVASHFTATSTSESSYFGGKVGIGTTTPQYKFQIHKTAAANTDLGTGPALLLSNWAQSTNARTDIAFGHRAAGVKGISAAITADNSGNLIFGTSFPNLSGLSRPQERLRINKDGEVGIGTTNPTALLSVNGEAKAEYFTATSTTATSTFAGGVNVANGSGYFYSDAPVVSFGSSGGGQFGISNVASGIANSQAFGYNNTASGVASVAFGFSNTASAFTASTFGYANEATSTSAIAFGYSNNAGGGSSVAVGYNNNAYVVGSIAIGRGITNTTANSLMIGPSDSSKLTILSSGNVGIGTTSPYAKLSVAGEVVASHFTATSTTEKSTFAGGINILDSASTTGYQINGLNALRIIYSGGSSGAVLVGELAGANNLADDLVAIGYRTGEVNTGDNNTFVGDNAGRDNTSGVNNMFLGSAAGKTNTTGASNVFIGANSGFTADSGSRNTFINSGAGAANSTASDNIYIGNQAGNANNTARNTMVGASSGDTITGGFNTIYGYKAGSGATAASNNVLFGYQAANNLTTGDNNVVIGYDVDVPSPTANNQLSIGNLIFGTGVDGTGTTLSSGNIGIGTTSPYAKLSVVGETVASHFTATSTTENSAFLGSLSVGADITATNVPLVVQQVADNKGLRIFGFDDKSAEYGEFYIVSNGNARFDASKGFIFQATEDIVFNIPEGFSTNFRSASTGFPSLFYIDEATTNIGIGTTSPYAKLSVVGSVVGSSFEATTITGYMMNGVTLLTASSSGNNLFAGYNAGTNITSGNYNTFIGSAAGNSTEDGDSNTYVGYQAGYLGTSAGVNTAFGHQALRGAVSASYNSSFGYRSLYNNTSGNSNIGFGYQSLFTNVSGTQNLGIGLRAGNLSTGHRNIFIGYQAGDNLTAGNNNLLIGHDIDAQDSTGSNQLSIGNIIFSEGVDGTGTTLSSGNIGIGTTSPSQKLEVAGNILSKGGNVYSPVLVGNVSNYPGIWFGTNTTAPSITNYAFLFDRNAGKGTTFNTPATYSISFRVNNSDKLRLSTSGGLALGSTYYSTDPGANNAIVEGSVGIGTTSPARPLHISNSFGVLRFGDDNSVVGTSQAGLEFYSDLTDTQVGRVGFFGDGNLLLQADTAGRSILFNTVATERMRLDQNGNLGIGTTSPYAKLSVVGGVVGEYFNATSTSRNNAFLGTVSVGTSTTVTDVPLVLGQSADEKGIRIYGAGANSDSYVDISVNSFGNLRFAMDATGKTGNFNNMNMKFDDNAFVLFGGGNDMAIGYNASNDSMRFSTLSTVTNGAGAAMDILNSNGYVGIGTTSPFAKLSVTGTAGASGPLFTVASSTDNPYLTVTADGNVGIGSTTPSYKLAVLGNVYASSFIDDGVTVGAPDYVFDDPAYEHLTLEEIEAFAEENAHLPWLTPRDSGPMSLSARINEVLEALENLFLKVFELVDWNEEQDDRIAELEVENETQNERIAELEALIEDLTGESLPTAESPAELNPTEEPEEPDSGIQVDPESEPSAPETEPETSQEEASSDSDATSEEQGVDESEETKEAEETDIPADEMIEESPSETEPTTEVPIEEEVVDEEVSEETEETETQNAANEEPDPVPDEPTDRVGSEELTN